MESLKKGDIFTNRVPESIRACIKLAELEKEWANVVGVVMANRSAPVACEFSDEGLIITINVNAAGILPAVKSRRTAIIKAISSFMGVKSVKIDIRVGKVSKISQIKEPLPAYKRRAPILISDRAIEKNSKVVGKDLNDPELTEAIAKIKTLAEKLNSRKNS